MQVPKAKFGLYIHIPFCQRKCGYCDFYSLAQADELVRPYLEALRHEIALYGLEAEYRCRQVDTIYFGGGTPSLLNPSQLESLFDTLHQYFDLSTVVETTIEANPGTISMEKLCAYRNIGINRLSLGVQSFFDQDLQMLGRIHTADEAQACVRQARAAGFNNLNIDLIFGIPGQSVESWWENLRLATTLGVDHLSIYNLIYEPGTPFARKQNLGKLTPIPEEMEAEMYFSAIDFLGRHGYQQYEISNFAQPGKFCQHNQNYWNGGEYLGLGASAHSFIDSRRFWNVADVHLYIKLLTEGKYPCSGEEKLTLAQQLLETIFLSLRCTKGLNIDRFCHRFGKDFLRKLIAVLENLQSAKEEPLWSLAEGHLRLTPQGFWFSDEVFSQFVLAASIDFKSSQPILKLSPTVCS